MYDVIAAGNARDVAAYWESIEQAPGVFLGVVWPKATRRWLNR
jgi:hypothetical protein